MKENNAMSDVDDFIARLHFQEEFIDACCREMDVAEKEFNDALLKIKTAKGVSERRWAIANAGWYRAKYQELFAAFCDIFDEKRYGRL